MQHAAWVVPPLVLAWVLGLSAAMKWGRGESLRSVVANVELPTWVLPRRLAHALPLLELCLAVGLLTPWPQVFTVAGAGSLVLMAVYWGLVARGLTLTPRPSCSCFGEVGHHEVTTRTLLRNTLLVAAAAASTALALSGGTTWSVWSGTGSGDWLWLGLAALACVVTGLVLAGSSAPARLPAPAAVERVDVGLDPAPRGAEVGDYTRVPTPSATLHRPERGPVTLLELSHRQAQLLVFVNCSCASTREVMAEVDRWNFRLDLVDVRMVFAVPIDETLVGTTPDSTLLDHAGLVWTTLGLTRSPSAVLLGVDGYLAGGPVGGVDDVVEFVHDVEDAVTSDR